jgi:hypothetical protein
MFAVLSLAFASAFFNPLVCHGFSASIGTGAYSSVGSSSLLQAAVPGSASSTGGHADDDEQDSFYFDPAPVDQDVVEGREARLRCDVSNRRSIVFYWTLNGRTVPNVSRRYQDDSDLRIVRADRIQDSGSFRCVATNVTTGIALRSIEAKLNVLCEYSTDREFRLMICCFFLEKVSLAPHMAGLARPSLANARPACRVKLGTKDHF